MKGWIYVHTPADYQKWAAAEFAAAPAAAEPKAETAAPKTEGTPAPAGKTEETTKK